MFVTVCVCMYIDCCRSAIPKRIYVNSLVAQCDIYGDRMQLSPAAGRVPTKPDRAQQDKDLSVRVYVCVCVMWI